MASISTKERAAEQVAHHRQRIAFVAGRGEQCTHRLFIHDGGIGRRVAFMVDQHAGRRLPFAVVGDAHLAHRDRAGSKIEQDGRRIAARQADGQRIGAEAALPAAVRRDDRAAHHVGEMDRREACGDRLLRPVPDAADVMRIAQPHDDDAVAACAFDREFHGLVCHRLADAAVAVHHQQRVGIGDNRDALIELQFIGLQRTHIRRHHAHAMRIVAGEVGADQMVGSELRLLLGAACRAPEVEYPLAHFFRR